jgi:site-specific recombinase XerD
MSSSSSTLAFLWPAMPKKSEKLSENLCNFRVPERSTGTSQAEKSTDCVSSGRKPLDFDVAKVKRTSYLESTPDFQERVERARAHTMQKHPEQFKLLPFSEAADIWLEEKKLHIKKPRTLEAYTLYISNLKKNLGQVQLSQIHIGHVLTYQQLRKAQKACASYVNHETNTLAQILKRADLWDLVEKHYKPLPTGNWTPPKVLTPEEEDRFFRVAASNPDWSVAYWAVSVTNNTSAVGTELRNLQLKHVFLDQKPPMIHIPDGKVKNEFRARVIPLNEVAEKQMRRIVERARKLGAGHPDHFIFPFRVNRGTWDVTRPASRAFIKKTFAQMREATGLSWLQPRNFRNQVITKLFESGAPDETITSIAGHQSIRMSQFYSRIRVDRKFEALSAILTKKKGVENAG